MRPNRSPLSSLSLRRSLRVVLAAGLPLIALTAVSAPAYSRHHHDEPTTFAGPQYGDEPPLSLNVATISVVDRGGPGLVPGDLSGRAPNPPDDLLKQLAHDRLLAAGSGGSGTFTIDRVSILHEPGGILDGQLNVHLDVTSADGRRTGYAVAQVTRSFDPQKKHGNSDTPQNLNTLTNLMLQDMNQELGNQIRANLGNWLVTPQAPGSVAAQPLDGDTPAVTTTTPAGPATGADTMTIGGGPTDDHPEAATAPAAAPTPARAKAIHEEPDAIFPEGYSSEGSDTAAPTPQMRSPQPGNLTLPGSTGQ